MARVTYNRQVLDAILHGKPAPKRIPKGPASSSESQIQQACINWFKAQYPRLWEDGVLFHIANEGVRRGGAGSRAKREGVVRGVADLCLAMPRKGYGALYIEMKKPGCYQRPDQKTWQKNIEKHGNKYVVIKSVESFMRLIQEYLN